MVVLTKVKQLKPCPFCGAEVTTRKEIREQKDGNTMYIFSIEHACAAIDRAHLSLFFQNASSRERCEAVLDKEEEMYTRLWNIRKEVYDE